MVCGHIHQPVLRELSNAQGSITYLNSGDWIENLSALEYRNGGWQIFRFYEMDKAEMKLASEDVEEELNNNQLFEHMLHEFNLMRQ